MCASKRGKPNFFSFPKQKLIYSIYSSYRRCCTTKRWECIQRWTRKNGLSSPYNCLNLYVSLSIRLCKCATYKNVDAHTHILCLCCCVRWMCVCAPFSRGIFHLLRAVGSRAHMHSRTLIYVSCLTFVIGFCAVKAKTWAMRMQRDNLTESVLAVDGDGSGVGGWGIWSCAKCLGERIIHPMTRCGGWRTVNRNSRCLFQVYKTPIKIG